MTNVMWNYGSSDIDFFFSRDAADHDPNAMRIQGK